MPSKRKGWRKFLPRFEWVTSVAAPKGFREDGERERGRRWGGGEQTGSSEKGEDMESRKGLKAHGDMQSQGRTTSRKSVPVCSFLFFLNKKKVVS